MRSRRGLGWLTLFVLVLTAESAYCFLHPIAYFDTFAYVSLQHRLADANNFAAAGRSCPSILPGAYNGCAAVTSSAIFEQAASLNSRDYATFLRFYTVKPLYNALAGTVLHALPIDMWRALRLISAGSFLLVGMLCVLWLRRLTGPAMASLGAIFLVSLPGTIGLGRALLPDALLTTLLLAGAFLLLFQPRRWWLGAGVLALATLVRSDALLFGMVLGALLIWQRSDQQKRWRRLGTLALISAGWAFTLAWATDALPWRVLFFHSFVAWTPPAEYLSLHVSPREYLRV